MADVFIIEARGSLFSGVSLPRHIGPVESYEHADAIMDALPIEVAEWSVSKLTDPFELLRESSGSGSES